MHIYRVLALAISLLLCHTLVNFRADGQADNLGTNFIVVFMKNDAVDPNIISLELYITTPRTIPVQVKVTAPKYTNELVDISVTVVSGVVEKVVVPAGLRMDWIAIEGKVVLVTADDDIILYALNKEKFSTDGFLVYPTDVIGYNYYTLSYAPTNSFTEFAVGTLYDNTNVHMRLPNKRNEIPIRVEWNGKTYTSGDWINITLNAYQSFQCATYDTADLTGTYIISDKPIAAFSGNARTWVGESPSRDHLAIQLPPIEAYGQDFAIIPTPARTVGDVVRVVAAEEMTGIIVENNVTSVYEIGVAGYHITLIVPSDTYTTISANKPILVAQISQSQQDPSEPGDPTMLVVTSSSQFTSDYIFGTPSYSDTASYDNWLMCVAKSDEIDGLLFDGKPFSQLQPTWKSLPGTDMVGSQVRISEGAHVLRHASSVARFSGYIYGTQDRESYSFQIGSRMAPINQPCITSEGKLGDGVDNDCDGQIDEEICTGENRGIDTDGDGLVDEDCTLTRNIAEDVIGVPDSGGKQFVVMFMENNVEAPQYYPLELFVTPTRSSLANVRVETPNWFEPSFREDSEVSLGSVKKFSVPYSLKVQGTTLTNKAVFVTSDQDVVVFGVNKEKFSSDAFLVFPIDVLGKEYYTVTHWPNSDTSLCQFGVVGIFDGTKVDITFPVGGSSVLNVEFQGQSYRNGETLTVAVGRFSTLQIQAKGDLSGTYIKATQKIGVFSGNIRTSVGAGSSRDHLVAMLPSLDSWGQLYCTVPIPGRSVGDYFYVIASEDGTTVEVTGQRNLTLTAGQTELVQLKSSDYAAFRSNKPVLVAQLSQSQRSTSEIGDPTMIILPASQQWANIYTFSTTTTAFASQDSSGFQNYLMLVALSDKFNGLIYDGEYLPELFTTWFVVTGTNYSATSFAISSGVHSIQHEDPTVTFSAIVYGNADKESYGFPVGMRLASINAPCETTYTIPGDGIDNDCDGKIDEEICEGEQLRTDEDSDSMFNEDCAALMPTPATTSTPLTTQLVTSGPTTSMAPIVLVGPPGPPGPQGSQGLPGPQGNPGENGIPGTNGMPGSPGSDGLPGEVGATGATGATGVVGPSGEPGRTGSTGAAGVVGPQGSQGATGSTGKKGEPGAPVTGETGEPGAPGLVGATGATGQAGEKGQIGAKGEVGEQGPTGMSGIRGETGLKGEMGPSYIDVNECIRDTDGCAHNCVNTIGSFYCTCDDGYKLDSNGRDCKDYNECDDNNGGCMDGCSNVIGSFLCSCQHRGYRLGNDFKSCVDIDECTESDANDCTDLQVCVNSLGSYICINNTVVNSVIEEVLVQQTSCQVGNGGCADQCAPTQDGFSCLCTNQGYRLANDQQSCVDIDECTDGTDSCETTQICVNSLGSFYCVDRTPASAAGSSSTARSQAQTNQIDMSVLLNGNLFLGLGIWLMILSILLLVLLLLIAKNHHKQAVLAEDYKEDLTEIYNQMNTRPRESVRPYSYTNGISDGYTPSVASMSYA